MPNMAETAALSGASSRLAHIVVPLDQLRAIDRLALVDLVPRVVADGGEGRVCRQVPALSAAALAAVFAPAPKQRGPLTDTH